MTETCEDCRHLKDINRSLGQCRCEKSPNYNKVLPKLNKICNEFIDKDNVKEIK